MSKKLLTESEIERFKRLAGLPSKSGMLNENYEFVKEAEEEEEEASPEGAGAAGADDGDMPMGDEEGGAPEDLEMGAGDEMGGEGGGESKEEAFKSVVQQLADLIGVDIDMGGEAGGEDLGGLEDAEGEEGEELDMSGGEGEGEEAPEEEPAEEEDEGGLEEANDGSRYVADRDDDKRAAGRMNESLINAVVERVAARLVAEAKKQKVKQKIKEGATKGATKGAAKGHGAGKGFKVKKLGNEYSLADKGDPRKAKKANDGGNQTVVAKGGTKAKELPHGAKKKGTGTGKNAQTN